jgi:hypothetical protein
MIQFINRLSLISTPVAIRWTIPLTLIRAAMKKDVDVWLEVMLIFPGKPM